MRIAFNLDYSSWRNTAVWVHVPSGLKGWFSKKIRCKIKPVLSDTVSCTIWNRNWVWIWIWTSHV